MSFIVHPLIYRIAYIFMLFYHFFVHHIIHFSYILNYNNISVKQKQTATSETEQKKAHNDVKMYKINKQYFDIADRL